MKRKETRAIVEIAILVVIAVIIDYLAGLFSPFKYGGSISPAMLSIFIISYRWGVKKGMLGGFVFAVIQLIIMGSEVFSWVIDPTLIKYIGVIFLDYVFPFMLLGLAGIFKNPLSNKLSFILGITLASFIRYIFHSISGVVIWGEYAADFGLNPWFYSFVAYNLPYMLSSYLFSLIIGLALFKRNVWEYNLDPK